MLRCHLHGNIVFEALTSCLNMREDYKDGYIFTNSFVLKKLTTGNNEETFLAVLQNY